MDKTAKNLTEMHHVDIYNQLDCSDVERAYKNFKEPFCQHMLNGFIEILVLGFLGIPLEVCLLWLGITFVLRNKVDVPKYEPPKQKDKKKKAKSKKQKQSGAINDNADPESANEGHSQDESDDDMSEGEDTDDDDD